MFIMFLFLRILNQTFLELSWYLHPAAHNTLASQVPYPTPPSPPIPLNQSEYRSPSPPPLPKKKWPKKKHPPPASQLSRTQTPHHQLHQPSPNNHKKSNQHPLQLRRCH